MTELIARGPRPVRLVLAARLASATGIAAVAAWAATATVYLLGILSGAVDEKVFLPSLVGMGPLSLASVSATTLAAVAAAGIMLAVVSVTTRRPATTFRILTSVLALLSLSMPATIPGPGPAMRLTMAAMHVVVWAICVGLLPTLVGRRRRGAA